MFIHQSAAISYTAHPVSRCYVAPEKIAGMLVLSSRGCAKESGEESARSEVSRGGLEEGSIIDTDVLDAYCLPSVFCIKSIISSPFITLLLIRWRGGVVSERDRQRWGDTPVRCLQH
ncbi:hypothetical protein J6590_050411 [Homalodisca vitripennis]|nr:hypothetical protein J6590_050411 [Homalodisca vitripennis]